MLAASQASESEIHAQRERVRELKRRLEVIGSPDARLLAGIALALVRKSVWIVGGDGWAYDIGFGGLDHVLSTGQDVNLLVLDTEVYSNTGGQASKSTPRGAVARFAAGGKPMAKKDLGLMAMSYGHVYVASVAMGAKDEHTLRAFLEAESYDGPSLILAYSHCIAHGIDMSQGLAEHRLAVDTGQWLLYRYDPRRAARGENPLLLEPHGKRVPLGDFLAREDRFRQLERADPAAARRLFDLAQHDVDRRLALYERLAESSRPAPPAGA
jgi:pyruvate-ferredoxin/flavodoxin oxidoreductase